MTIIIRFSIVATLNLLTASYFFPVNSSAQSLDFKGKEFRENIDTQFWERHSQRGIKLKGKSSKAIFSLPVGFEETKFHSTADFSGVTFDSSTRFSFANFVSKADFSRATFNSTVEFWRATFNSKADFGHATFDSTAFFSEAVFNSKADFSRTSFKFANFLGATFDSTAYFGYATFSSTAYFRGVTFESSVSFRGAKFLRNADFYAATLPTDFDFRDVAIDSTHIDFYSARLPRNGDRCKIALSGTDLNKIRLNMKLFKLWFPVDTFKIPLLSGKDSVVIDSLEDDGKARVYETALKKIKDDGFPENYQILDIEYRQFKYHLEGAWIRNTFDHYWWNYRYKKVWILRWSSFFWGLFSFLNLWFYPKLSENVYRIEFLDKFGYRKSIFKRWWSRILQATTYTAIVFFGLKMDLDKFKKGAVKNHPGWFAYLMFIYVVGIFCLGFIVNYIFS